MRERNRDQVQVGLIPINESKNFDWYNESPGRLAATLWQVQRIHRSRAVEGEL